MKQNHIEHCDKCDFIIHSEEHKKKHFKVRHEGENGLLWVADSINSNADFNFLSRAMDMKIQTAKAYAAIYDEHSHYPEKNFLDVLDRELKKGSFKALVIGGGSVDISNMDTVNQPELNIAELREKAIKSAHKLFRMAEFTCEMYPSIRKDLLIKALKFASKYIKITAEERKIILRCRN